MQWRITLHHCDLLDASAEEEAVSAELLLTAWDNMSCHAPFNPDAVVSGS